MARDEVGSIGGFSNNRYAVYDPGRTAVTDSTSTTTVILTDNCVGVWAPD